MDISYLLNPEPEYRPVNRPPSDNTKVQLDQRSIIPQQLALSKPLWKYIFSFVPDEGKRCFSQCAPWTYHLVKNLKSRPLPSREQSEIILKNSGILKNNLDKRDRFNHVFHLSTEFLDRNEKIFKNNKVFEFFPNLSSIYINKIDLGTFLSQKNPFFIRNKNIAIDEKINKITTIIFDKSTFYTLRRNKFETLFKFFPSVKEINFEPMNVIENEKIEYLKSLNLIPDIVLKIFSSIKFENITNFNNFMNTMIEMKKNHQKLVRELKKANSVNELFFLIYFKLDANVKGIDSVECPNYKKNAIEMGSNLVAMYDEFVQKAKASKRVTSFSRSERKLAKNWEIKCDDKQAIQMLERAAKHEFPPALYLWSRFQFFNMSLPENLPVNPFLMINTFLSQSAHLGYEPAKEFIFKTHSNAYLKAETEIERSKERNVLESAAKNLPNLKHYLHAFTFLIGDGVEKDFAKGQNLLKQLPSGEKFLSLYLNSKRKISEKLQEDDVITKKQKKE